MSGVYARAGAMADAIVALIPTAAPRIVTCAGDKDVTVRPLSVDHRLGRLDVYGDGGTVLVMDAPGIATAYREVTDADAAAALAAWMVPP